MRISKGWFSLIALVPLGLALLLASSAPAPEIPASGALDAAWWKRTEPFVRRVLNLPPAVQLKLKDIQPAGTEEFRIILLEARQGGRASSFLFYASTDGKRAIIDQLYDLTQDPFAPNRARILLDNSPSQGPEKAPLTVVEYSDYTCVFCQRFFLTVEKPMLKRFEGRLRFVYKQFPLTGMRAWSEDAALAAACAHRQSNEAFWALHNELFVHLERLKEKGIFDELATKLPLDAKKFKRCLEKKESLPDVQRDFAEGEKLGVSGTPTFFINGRPVHGLPRRERFLEILEEELALASA